MDLQRELQMKRIIADNGINWIWYLTGEFDEAAKTVEIKNYDRWHKGEGGHPDAEWNGQLRIDEAEGRIATHVRVGDTIYTVTNPANVFSYRGV